VHSYYGNVNQDVLRKIPVQSARVLEIGCGLGRLGQAFKARVPGCAYFGVELMHEVAQEARARLDGVLCANIEHDVSRVRELAEHFDALVLGDVLEHFQDPWRVLTELRSFMTPDGMCVACIPNVGHWSMVAELLQGKWRYADQGLLDKTHLRFFTLDTAVELFEKAGWTVLDALPRKLQPEETEAALKTLLPAAVAMGMSEDKARVNLTAFQWVIRAVNGPAPRVTTVAAVGSKKVAGVTEARVDHPMRSLATLPAAKVHWREGTLVLPEDAREGVLVLHRELLTDAKFQAQMEALIAKGWLLVLDMDDDPNHWSDYVDSDFYAFKAVHAVTVSTEHLADVVRPFNANVQVFANAIFELPWVKDVRHKTDQGADLNAHLDVASEAQRVEPSDSQKLRVFFGALNRQPDWQAVMAGIVEAALALKDRVEFVVVHDQAFYDALPADVSKTFSPTLGIEQYTQTLASCDIALLPLNDTPFNRCKSDLKLIECAAAQVAVICSEVVYAKHAAHATFASFATTADEWRDALLKLANDVSLREDNIAKGLAYVKKERMHAQQSAARLAFYQGMMADKDNLAAQRVARVADWRAKR
jgi:2-polyprenyl-3-methyl-5-hydroxy-6-metoxy-1,4-benzoquinol methylase